MEDRFKFRVRDKVLKCYLSEDSFAIENDGLIENNGHGNYGGFTGDEGSRVVEQCTGFKDRSGSLIYEGSVLDVGIDSPVEVFWLDACGCWCVRGGWLSGDDLANYYERAVVLGNVHDNGDLLSG